jgi:hypothetical protein
MSTKRERDWETIVAPLLKRLGKATFADLQARTGLSPARLSKALAYGRLESSDVVGVASPHNSYEIEYGWGTASKQGLGNQIRHAKTRVANVGVQLGKAERRMTPTQRRMSEAVRAQGLATEIVLDLLQSELG